MDFLSRQPGADPTGLVRSNPPGDHPISRTHCVISDLLGRRKLGESLASVCPDAVIHLAGLTRGTPEALDATNVSGTQNLLDATLAANPDCRILVISSSAIYGNAGDHPIAENTPLKPLSIYGMSKMAQDSLSLSYGNRQGAVSVARPFNLAGPGLAESFVCGRIVKQVIEIEYNMREAIDLWEVSSARDLIDVRDVVRGYWALLTYPDFTADCSGKAFNLGSGNAYPVSEIITLIEEITGDHYRIQLPITPPEIPIPSQKSDNTMMTTLTGWKPKIALKKTLRDMLEAERKE